MSGVVDGFLVIVAVVLVGYVVGRTGLLGPAATQVLSRVSFFVGTPALLFVTLLRADVGAVLSQGLLVTAVTSSVACLLYVPIGRLRGRPPGETVVGAMASGYVNAANLGFPIATYVLGDPARAAPALLFQLVVLTPVFSTLLDVVTTPREDGRRPPPVCTLTAPLRNPLVLAAAAGLLAGAAGWVPPAPLLAPVELLGALAVPCMLLAFGISLHGARRPGAGATAPLLAATVLLKNVVHPLLALGLGLLLGMRGPALLAVVVLAALPTAQNVFGYSVRFDTGVVLARDAALVTTVLSVPAMFLVVAVLG